MYNLHAAKYREIPGRLIIYWCTAYARCIIERYRIIDGDFDLIFRVTCDMPVASISRAWITKVSEIRPRTTTAFGSSYPPLLIPLISHSIISV